MRLKNDPLEKLRYLNKNKGERVEINTVLIRLAGSEKQTLGQFVEQDMSETDNASEDYIWISEVEFLS